MGNNLEIVVLESNEAVADFAVTKWQEITSRAIAHQGYCATALSGGRTPVEFYRRLAAAGGALPWDKVHVFLADERFVPPEDKESNYRLIREHLLEHVSIPDGNVHPVHTQGITLEESAQRYEADITRFFHGEGDTIPRFDLIMLGMGEDGHTASLFPGTGLLRVTERLALPVIADRVPSHRITLSLPVLTNAKRIMFLVTGANKAAVVKEIIENEECTLPVALVVQQGRAVCFAIDESAGSLLSQKRNKM